MTEDSFIPAFIAPNEAAVLSVDEVVGLEQRIAQDGLPLDTLMRRAGKAAAQFVQQHWPRSAATRVVVVCGTGNNGGDGWVVAAALAAAGYPVTVITPVPAEEVKAEPARTEALRCMEEGSRLSSFSVSVAPTQRDASEMMERADVVIDALLGTGFDYREIHEPTAGYVRSMQHIVEGRNVCSGMVPPAIVAIDVPSGLSARSGQAADPCVNADYTVTMMVMKEGMTSPAARIRCGDVVVARIAAIDSYLA